MGAKSQQGDPAADMALVEILDKPSGTVITLKKIFTPQEPQMSLEEAAMAQGGGPGGPGDASTGPPPAVQTVLAQMESEGGGGGVQSVGQF